jgi:hypothetical protein
LFVTVIRKVNRDLPCRGVNHDISRVWERWALLHVPVAYEPKVKPLRKDSGLVVNRAILETEDQMGNDPIPMDDLEEIPCGKSFALPRTQRKKSLDRALPVTHRYWFSRQPGGLEQPGPHEHAHDR